MSYKLIALDIDGTLTNDDKEITERTRKALSKAHDMGVSIALASGRPVYGVMPVARELGLDRKGDYVISFNGGQIFDVGIKKTVFEHTLHIEEALAAYSIAKEFGLVTVTYKDDHLITEDPDDQYVQIESRINHMAAEKTPDFSECLDFRPVKCLVVGEEKRIRECEEEALRRLGARLSIYRSTPYFLEIMPKGIDKGAALSRLVGLTGLIRQEIMACGDGMNDLAMIRFAELGVAMANAEPEVREAADFVTDSNNDDGVAKAVERFILNEK